MNDRQLDSHDLRSLADVLDSLTGMTERTGISVNGYGDDHLDCGGLMVRFRWLPQATQTASQDVPAKTPKGAAGRYVIDLSSS